MDESTATPPSVRRTGFVSLVMGLWDKYVPVGKSGAGEGWVGTEEDDGIDETESGTEGSGTVTPKEGVSGGGSKPGRAAATTMAGGRRRKAPRRK